jgi:type II secretory ATPase GspE/PulE/Tfp pilus assembly ATPase PilB-like protein
MTNESMTNHACANRHWSWAPLRSGGQLGHWCFAAASLMLVALTSDPAAAQDAWPPYSSGLPGPNDIARGPGSYFAIWKVVMLVVLVWLWVKSADWIGRDTDAIGDSIGMPSRIWNPIMVLVPLIGFFLAITIPIFFAGWAAMLVMYVAPFAVYVAQRNGRVTSDQKVFTPDHLKNWFASLGKKQPKERVVKHAWEAGPAVEMISVGPLQLENQQALIEARNSGGFVATKYLLADAFAQRAERIMLDYTADAVAVRYQVDGVWINVTPKVDPKKPLDRTMGDAIEVVLKRLCHLKPQERRAKQEGKMRVEFEGSKYNTTLTTQGTQTGERAIVHFLLITKAVRSLDDLGMRDKQREALNSILGPGQHGVVVFASLPGDGLSATWSAALRGTDRLMRDFISIEEINKREPEVENVDVAKFEAAKGEKPEDVVPKLILKQPEVMCIPELTSGEALSRLTKWIQEEDKLGIVSVRAKDATDAVIRLLSMKAPPEGLSATLRGVVYTRLIRKLCETCRQAMQPSPELLQKLGIPQGRVQVLYQEKQPLQPGEQRKRGEPEICPNCRGLGYKGRTAIFEILVFDDKLKQALLKAPNAEAIKKLARAAGHRTLQEEGVLLVALGTTSLAELQRVLKQ